MARKEEMGSLLRWAVQCLLSIHKTQVQPSALKKSRGWGRKQLSPMRKSTGVQLLTNEKKLLLPETEKQSRGTCLWLLHRRAQLGLNPYFMHPTNIGRIKVSASPKRTQVESVNTDSSEKHSK